MLRPSESPSAGTGPASEEKLYLERVGALLPRIAEAAEEIERERRIPSALLDAMIDAGLFRLLLPRSVGGAEVHPLTFMAVVEAIGTADASPAWNVCQNAVCAISAAYLEPAVARRIFGDPRAILAWGPAQPEARAVVTEGGYRVTGRWSFASGGRHATWLGAYCPIQEADGTPRRGKDGGIVHRVVLLPAAEVTLEDVWHVIGLRGTASDAFAVEERFVPEDYTLMRDDLSEVREPGWLYRFKTTNLFACGFASLALGVARTMLDDFIGLALEKTPRGYSSTLRENAATQSDLAQAEAQLRSARAYLIQSVSDICEAAQRTHQVTLEQRIAIRLAATHAIRQAQAVGDFAYEAAGASAIFTANPFERRFRDLHTVAQQLQGRKSHYQTVGKYLLGLEAETHFL
ncbi:MAG: acyl-CoA dehydrogenase family protein [SAR324 cluster bacterium]|nr:acyl-CoA dehydrogenase family protein [SAR324 cluster bacterium]